MKNKKIVSGKKDTKKEIATAAPRNDTPGVYQLIDVAKIKPWSNYRKTFKLKGLEELTDSVKSKGVLQPIIVRPKKGNGSFEIVTGHRRHTAAKDAGLKQMPCILKECTDEEVIEIQVIENSQREDVNPMEEGIGFKKLIEMGKHTPETLAKKLDKSLSYVFGRLSLAKLPEEVQKAVLGEKITLGHALVLTRLRHASEQKEMLKAIFSNEWSVRDTANNIEDFSHDIKDAVFDTKACDKCPYLSRNQTVLFPELKKTGECMDRGCYAKKTMDFYKAFLDEKKKQGFKVITDKKEFLTLRNSNKGIEIYQPDTGHYSSVPKRYKSECVKCTEHHAYFLYEEEAYRGSKHIYFGEMCTNKKCLDAMNRQKADRETDRDTDRENSGNGGRISPHTIAAHARACRDRFLREQLPGKVEASETLQKRLLIYTLLVKYGGDFDEKEIEMLKELMPSCDGALFDNEYSLASEIDAKLLDAALKTILLLTVPWTNPDVLLEMTPEAGIDMSKDFGPDETFLESKTKDELIKFISTHKLAVEVPKSGKKGDIVKAIAAQDLRGKLTKELKEECEIGG